MASRQTPVSPDRAARDPESASQGVMMAKKAFSAGTVAHVLETQGTWHTVLTVQDEQVQVSITRRPWWR